MAKSVLLQRLFKKWRNRATFDKIFQLNRCPTRQTRLYILSPPPVVSFSGAQNRETNGVNETIGGGLKELEEIGDFLQIVRISTVKMKQMEQIGDFRQSLSIKGWGQYFSVNFLFHFP